MTEEEIEVVAQELAKAGGTSWYPGRNSGTVLRVVSDRYRDQARIIIEAFDRLRSDHPTTFSHIPMRPAGTDHPRGPNSR